MIRILAEENVDKPVVEALRQAGFEVDYVLEIALGTENGEVLEMAQEKWAILLTADKDFGELVRFSSLWRGSGSKGVVLLRLPGLPPVRKAKLVVDFFQEHGIESWRSSWSSRHRPSAYVPWGQSRCEEGLRWAGWLACS